MTMIIMMMMVMMIMMMMMMMMMMMNKLLFNYLALFFYRNEWCRAQQISPRTPLQGAAVTLMA